MARVDRDALDRKLRPIYDALDAHNYKAALKLATAALAKYPSQPALNAVKAIALDRSGKSDEALQVVDTVLLDPPSDYHALNLLSMVLKPNGRNASITAAYEKAVEKDPKNADLLVALFNSYLRDFNFAKVQQLSVKMHKVMGGTGYLWAQIVTIVVQAVLSKAGAEAAMEPGKLLSLAESMMARQAARDSGLDSQEQLMLYLDVLQSQGKYSEALEAVSGKLGNVIHLPAERLAMRAALMLAQGNRAQAAELYQAALQENCDDWASLLLYLDCQLPRSRSPASGALSSIPSVSGGVGSLPALLAAMQLGGEDDETAALERAAEQIELLSQAAPGAAAANGQNGNGSATPSTSSTPSTGTDGASSSTPGMPSTPSMRTEAVRGPQLARVELAARKLKLGVAGQRQLAEAVAHYYWQLGHMISCAADLRAYTTQVEGDERSFLAAAMNAHFEEQKAAAGGALDGKLLRKLISLHQVQHDLGLLRFGSLREAQEATAQLLSQLGDNREYMDDVATLVASMLLSSGRDLAAVLQALLVLEAAVLVHPTSAQLLLALCALYGLLGCPVAAAVHFRKLEVKHIQLDTLAGHHLLPVLSALHCQAELTKPLSATLQFFSDHMQNAGDSIATCYKHGSYSKVLEFVAFRYRLERSHTRALAVAEQAAQNLVAAADQGLDAAAPAVEAAARAVGAAAGSSPGGCVFGSPQWRERMRFNEDLATRPCWLPPSTAPCSLAVADWWERLPGAEFEGYARCWWSSPRAAESSHPAALQWREAQLAAVERRALLPHLLSGALAGTHSAPEGVIPITEAVQLLAGTLGGTPGQSVDALLEGCGHQPPAASREVAAAAAGHGGWGVLSSSVELLGLATFALAAALQESIQEGPGSQDLVQSRASACERLFRSFAQGLAAGFDAAAPGDAPALAPGGLLVLASSFVHEQAAWLVLVLQARSQELHSSAKKGKKGKKNEAPDASRQSATLPGAAAALTTVAAALAASCQTLANALRRFSERLSGASKPGGIALLSFGQSGGGTGEAHAQVWDWQERLDVNKVLGSVAAEQLEAFTALEKAMARRQQQAAAITF